MSSDFLIVGGGVIGLSIARELRKRGAGTIRVVDQSRIGAEASWAAAGMLAPNAECHAADELFRLCNESNRMYPQLAEELLDETGIDIELDRSGTLSLSFDDEDGAALAETYRWQREAGIPVEWLSVEDVLKLEPQLSSLVQTALFYPNDWQVENRKLIAALRRYCELNAIELVENAAATELVAERDRLLGVRTGEGVLAAGTIILAAGAWTSRLTGDSIPAVKPIRGQMISLAGGERKLKSVIYGANAYIVPRVDGRVLVGATVEDDGFNKTVTDKAIGALKSAANRMAPFLADCAIESAWAGLRPFAHVGMPVVGRLPELANAFVATGHYRNGILLAPITAKMIADQIGVGSSVEANAA